MTLLFRNRRRLACVLAALLAVLAAPAALPAEAAPEMRTIDFENGTRMGFAGRGETEILTVTEEAAHSGTRSLLTTGREKAWHGPSINIEYYADPGAAYVISVWVLPKTPEESTFILSTQIGEGDGAVFYNIDKKKVPASQGWAELTGVVLYPESDYITVYIENEDPAAEFYIDDISLAPAVAGGIRASVELPSLHEAYAGYFPLGTAISRTDMSGLRLELVKRHFNLLTPGNDMKPAYLGQGDSSRFAFNSADGIADLMLEEGFPIHGHTLVWHQQSARWLNQDAEGGALTRAEAKANLELYISTVAGHYAGRVISWDVVNEAFSDNPSGTWESGLRKDAAWYRAYENGADTDAGESGADYIYDAFVFARLADPGAVLYYNDFNEEYKGKREAMALMAESLNRKWEADGRNAEPGRKLVEGLGMQAHYSVNSLNPQDVEDTIARFIEAGVEVGVTELDISGGSWPNFRPLSEAEVKKQAELYARLFQIYVKYADHISRVTIWGIDDPTSWRKGGQPLLFDGEGGAKPAFYAVLDPEGYLAGEYDRLFDGSQQAAVPSPNFTAPSAGNDGDGGNGEESGDGANSDGNEDDGEKGSGIFWIIGAVVAAAAAGAVIYGKKRR